MPITPSGPMCETLVALQTTIANCPAWHDWVGVSNRPAPQRVVLSGQRTHLFGLPDPVGDPNENGMRTYTRDELEAMRPCCVLTYLPPAFVSRTGYGYQWKRVANEHFIERGTAYVHVIDDVAPGREEFSWASLVMDFTNKLGALAIDMLKQGGVDGAAFIQGIDLCVEPNRSTRVQEDATGDFINAMLKVDWGLER